jgi:hypothetical protein
MAMTDDAGEKETSNNTSELGQLCYETSDVYGF